MNKARSRHEHIALKSCFFCKQYTHFVRQNALVRGPKTHSMTQIKYTRCGPEGHNVTHKAERDFMKELQTSNLDNLAKDINQLKKTAAECIFEIGLKLIEAKELVQYGQWRNLLEENVDMSERTARNYMKLSKSFKIEERQALAEVDPTKLLYLAQIPEVEREYFLKAVSIRDTSTRKLEFWVRVWNDHKFRADTIRAITDNLASKGKVKELTFWKEELKRLSQSFAEMIIDLESKIGQLTARELLNSV